jgi:hypothetical protein
MDMPFCSRSCLNAVVRGCRYVYSVNGFNDFIWLASKDGVGLANRRLPLLYKGRDLDILTQPGQHSRNLRIWLVRVLLSKVWSNFGAAQG